VLGFSTQDYLMHSISSLFLPAAALAVGGLLWIAIDARAPSFILARRSRLWIRTMLGALSVSWALLPLLAIVASQAWSGLRDIAVPLSLTIGLLLAVSAQSLRRLLTRDSKFATRRNDAPVWHSPARRTFLGILIVLSLFWTVADYAQIVGRGLGERVISDLDTRPGVVVYSAQRLQIVAPGVEVTQFDGADAAYQFRYSGFRLLQRSNGRYFLIPRGWTETNGIIVVVRDSEPIRVEFVRNTFD
jgi:hypothetical protein